MRKAEKVGLTLRQWIRFCQSRRQQHEQPSDLPNFCTTPDQVPNNLSGRLSCFPFPYYKIEGEENVLYKDHTASGSSDANQNLAMYKGSYSGGPTCTSKVG